MIENPRLKKSVANLYQNTENLEEKILGRTTDKTVFKYQTIKNYILNTFFLNRDSKRSVMSSAHDTPFENPQNKKPYGFEFTKKVHCEFGSQYQAQAPI